MKSRTQFSIHGIALHSGYNPEIQAERFITRNTPPDTRTILIIGAGFGFLCAQAKRLFPHAKILAVKASPEIPDETPEAYSWDSGNHLNLFQFLRRSIQYGDMIGLQVLYWQPGCRLLEDHIPGFMYIIQSAIEMIQMELVTMGTFGRRFLINSVHNAVRIKPESLHLPDKPILLAAPGPSLNLHLAALRDHRADYNLIAVSSALQPLISADLYPDAVIAIDGGYYARELLSPLSLPKCGDIPLLAYPQAAIPRLLNNRLLIFGDPTTPEGSFFPSLSGLAAAVETMGTVTAAAANLLDTIYGLPVLFVGLDLQSSPFQTHADNHHSIRHQLTVQSRTRTLLSSCVHRHERGSAALQTYRSWFASHQSVYPFRLSTAAGGTDVLPEQSIQGFVHESASAALDLHTEGVAIADVRGRIERITMDVEDYLCRCMEIDFLSHSPQLEYVIYTTLPKLHTGNGSIDYPALCAEWNSLSSRLLEIACA
ncbi:MAG: 6-hydroxymethylpterin diphosphokinase MptE-like protein [Spirochaeta sp.]